MLLSQQFFIFRYYTIKVDIFQYVNSGERYANTIMFSMTLLMVLWYNYKKTLWINKEIKSEEKETTLHSAISFAQVV